MSDEVRAGSAMTSAGALMDEIMEDDEGYEGDDGSDTTSIKYFPLEQHPEAKRIYDEFDPHKLRQEATLADIEHFDGIWPAIELYLFFKQAPSNFNHYYTHINHNIRSYTLYKLASEKKIKLHSFDSTGALTALKISPHEEVLAPAVGRFVVTVTHEDGDFPIIINLERHPYTVEWSTYTSNSVHFSIFDRMFREAIKDCNFYIGKVFDNHGKFLDLPDTSFDDIYLEPELRDEVNRNIIDYIDKDSVALKKKNGIPTKRGVIFAGAPGTGKTYLSRVLANTLNTSFMVVTEVLSIGDLNQIFDFAQKFDRIVVLFEDIDIYIQDRNFGSSLLPVLLNRLDGVEVNNHIVVICTTNDVEVMDKALKDRPGRFDRALNFETPSRTMKTAMLRGFCKGKSVDDVNFDVVTKIVPERFTGAHLKEIYITACNEAIENGELDKDDIVMLTTDRFMHAVNSVKNRKELSRIGFSK